MARPKQNPDDLIDSITDSIGRMTDYQLKIMAALSRELVAGNPEVEGAEEEGDADEYGDENQEEGDADEYGDENAEDDYGDENTDDEYGDENTDDDYGDENADDYGEEVPEEEEEEPAPRRAAPPPRRGSKPGRR